MVGLRLLESLPSVRSRLHRVEMSHGGNEKRSIGRRRGGADGLNQFDRIEQLLFLARGKHVKIPAPSSQINLAIRNKRRGPNFPFDFMSPMSLAGFGIDAVKHA